jgi:hypothetical protein
MTQDKIAIHTIATLSEIALTGHTLQMKNHRIGLVPHIATSDSDNSHTALCIFDYLASDRNLEISLAETTGI